MKNSQTPIHLFRPLETPEPRLIYLNKIFMSRCPCWGCRSCWPRCSWPSTSSCRRDGAGRRQSPRGTRTSWTFRWLGTCEIPAKITHLWLGVFMLLVYRQVVLNWDCSIVIIHNNFHWTTGLPRLSCPPLRNIRKYLDSDLEFPTLKFCLRKKLGFLDFQKFSCY